MDSIPFGIEGYSLVRAKEEDRDFIIGCMRDSIVCSVPMDEKDLRDLWIDDILQIVSDDMDSGKMENEVFKLIRGDEDVGMLWMGVSKDQYTCDDTGYLLGIYVREDLRRKGLGRELVRSAETWCRSKYLVSMTLNVGAVNVPAMNLYRGSGYSDQSIVMRRVLR